MIEKLENLVDDNKKDAKVLDGISTILNNGKSSILSINLVDDKKMALQAIPTFPPTR